MMADDDYEILPHQLLADLKGEVEALKKKLTQPDAKMNELILEMESLKDSIHELTSIFQKALEETKEQGDVSSVILGLKEKMELVTAQNETIAKGMIAIADKVDDWIAKQRVDVKPNISPNLAPGVAFGGPRLAPPPAFTHSTSAPEIDFPPPPPMGGKRKSLGGLFR